MSKVLITGIAGLLGAHFSRHLITNGHSVVGIDNLSGGYKEFVPESAKFYECDLSSALIIDNIFEIEKPDYVYHFAAYAAEGLSPFVRTYNYTNNVICSSNIINSCINHGVKKLIYTSSMAVYGKGDPPYTELQVPMPEDPYGIAKYAVEQDLVHAKRLFGLDYSIIRPHNVVGIYQNIWDRYRNVIGIWVRKAIANEPITIYGDGTQRRAFSDVKFYMEPFEKLMTLDKTNGETYNIGADKDYSINEVADIFLKVSKEFGLNTSPMYYEARDEVKIAHCSHTKAKLHLGFADETNLEETIRELFVWALEQPQRNVKNLNYEIQKNIYSYWRN